MPDLTVGVCFLTERAIALRIKNLDLSTQASQSGALSRAPKMNQSYSLWLTLVHCLAGGLRIEV